MAVPRPLLLALIGVVLLAATFMATRNSSEQASSSSSPDPKPADVAQTPAAPAKPAPQKADPKPADKPAAKASSAPEKKADSAPARKRSSELSKVAAVARALEARRVVVLAFYGPGTDDRLTRSAVASLPRRQAAVFSERLSRIGRYRDLIGSLGVSQAPAVVVIDRQRQARVVEGYVDAETLAQEVTDARG